MTSRQRQSLEKTLATLSAQEKRELIDRLSQSLGDEIASTDRARKQREALRRLCRTLEALPSAALTDGFTNRDHDQVLYSR